MQINPNAPWKGQGEQKTSAVTASQKAPCGFSAQRICNLLLCARSDRIRARGLAELRDSLERAIPKGYNIYLVPGASLRLTDADTRTLFHLQLETKDGMPQVRVAHNNSERAYGALELPGLHDAFWKLCMEVSAVSEKASLNPGPFIWNATLAALSEGPAKN